MLWIVLFLHCVVPVCSPGHMALDRKPCKWWVKLSRSEGIPIGFHKHSFSLLVTLQIFLNGNSFAIILYIHIHTNTQSFLCLFLQKDFPPLLASPGPLSSGAGTKKRQRQRQWGSNWLSISSPRTTSIFLQFLSFLPTSLLLEKWRPLFFPSANTSRVFQAWRLSQWAVNNQSSIHRAGRGNGNVKYRAL